MDQKGKTNTSKAQDMGVKAQERKAHGKEDMPLHGSVPPAHIPMKTSHAATAICVGRHGRLRRRRRGFKL